MPASHWEPERSSNRMPHTFRQGLRASFLYPSWLSSEPKPALGARHLQIWSLKLRLTLMRLIPGSTALKKAQKAFLLALIEEHELSFLQHSEQEWKKSLLHQTRQHQLSQFELILQAYDQQCNPGEEGKLHPFPEIILVMAKTLTESPASQPELAQSAGNLSESYQQLRAFLSDQSAYWHPYSPKLEAEDLFISRLLYFRLCWDEFRLCRAAQLKRQSTSEHPALDSVKQAIQRQGESLI